MDLPLGFNEERSNGKVHKLKKPLYGLKQSLQAQFDKFAKAIEQQGYKQAHTNHTLFDRHKDSKIMILIVYVDDIILTRDDKAAMEQLKERLALEFEIKKLGKFKVFPWDGGCQEQEWDFCFTTKIHVRSVKGNKYVEM